MRKKKGGGSINGQLLGFVAIARTFLHQTVQ